METGEENEETEFYARAKLFSFVNKEWKERGAGMLKINVQIREPNETGPVKARFIMRADGSHKFILNSPLQKNLHFGGPDG